MSVVTSVLAFFLKASFGRRIAPSKSPCCDTHSRRAPSSLSSVPLEVINRISPPGEEVVVRRPPRLPASKRSDG